MEKKDLYDYTENDTEWFIIPTIIDELYILNDTIDSESDDTLDIPPTPPTTPTTPITPITSTINTDIEANQIKLNKCRIISYCNNSSSPDLS